MNKEDYEKYYQKGGSYIIPVEIFNELLDDYECFKNDCKKYKEVIDKAISKLGRYADELMSNGNAYAICVDLLDILKEVE